MMRVFMSIFLILGVSAHIFAQGGLLVTPTRVVFEDRARSESLILVNRSTHTKTFRLFFVEMAMNSEGFLAEVPDPHSHLAASDMIRFSPRQVTLAPGQTQKVRLFLRVPPGLKDGEYRSHLVFQALPEVQPQRPQTTVNEGTSVGIQLTPLIGASIPMIVRRGNPTAKVEILAMDYLPGTNEMSPNLEVVFQKVGNASVYGDLRVEWLPKEGKPLSIGGATGMAIYPEISQRSLQLSLSLPSGIALESGEIYVRYVEAGGGNTLAEKHLGLP